MKKLFAIVCFLTVWNLNAQDNSKSEKLSSDYDWLKSKSNNSETSLNTDTFESSFTDMLAQSTSHIYCIDKSKKNSVSSKMPNFRPKGNFPSITVPVDETKKYFLDIVTPTEN